MTESEAFLEVYSAVLAEEEKTTAVVSLVEFLEEVVAMRKKEAVVEAFSEAEEERELVCWDCKTATPC